MNPPNLSNHEANVMQAMRFADIQCFRHKSTNEIAYASRNGPVPVPVLCNLLRRRLITSVLDETRCRVFYRLTEFGRAQLCHLQQSGLINVGLQA